MNTSTASVAALLRAFHGDPKIKKKYLDRVRAHRAADEIASGFYWENGKGCAVGCTIHGSSHGRYEVELGIPRRLAYLEDRYFERLFSIDPVRAKEWPERFITAPHVGADLSLVWPRFVLWFLLDEQHGAIRAAKSKEIFSGVTAVGELYREWVTTGVKPALDRFSTAAKDLGPYRWYWRAADRRSFNWNEAYKARIILSSDKLLDFIQAAPVVQ